MKYVIVTVIATIVAFVGVVVAKAVNSSSVYLDDSFRWGGRDG